MTIDEWMRRVRSVLPELDGDAIDPAIFAITGVSIVRGAVPCETATAWRALFDAHAHRRGNGPENRANPVEFKRDLPLELEALSREAVLLDHVQALFGENIGLYQRRFVVKDQAARGAVMLHHDSSYHIGTPHKASAFLALGPVDERNGGMYFLPGTARFGMLGDAGEIARSVLPDDWPVIRPVLAAGDLVLMDSATWHGSGPHQGGPDRVMTDFIYQRADDASTLEVVRGTGWDDTFLQRSRAALFRQSRAGKLRQMRQVLDGQVLPSRY